MFGVTILGNNSAIPAYSRHPTAQIVTLNEQQILIDCGEGTQMQIARYKIKRSRINHILISHLHGDHYFGLIGLLTSMGLMGRTQTLHVYGPPCLYDIIQLQLKAADTALPFIIDFHPIEQEGVIANENKFTIECFAVQHRIKCYGFIIREKKQPRKLDKDKLLQHNIPTVYYNNLKNGQDYLSKDGTLIKNEWVTIANAPAKSYAYSADTIFDISLAEKVKQVNLLYHEATYLHALEQRAAERFHSTTIQAATIAQQAQVKQLIIGHFSSKYEALDDFETEAKSVFSNTQLALEGVTYLIK